MQEKQIHLQETTEYVKIGQDRTFQNWHIFLSKHRENDVFIIADAFAS